MRRPRTLTGTVSDWLRKLANRDRKPSRHRYHRSPFAWIRRAYRFQRIEILEPRTLLAANTIEFHTASGTVTVEGAEQNDALYAVTWGDHDILFWLDSDSDQTRIIAGDSITGIVFLGMGGDDFFWNGTDLSSFAIGGDGSDVLYGGQGRDVLIGGPGDDRLYGNDGIDYLRGDTGSDVLDGGFDDDLLYGGPNDDFLFGQLGNDRLFGEQGNDSLVGNAGDDKLFGGIGDDLLTGDGGRDRLYGEAGTDQLIGGEGRDILDGGSGEDTLLGGPEADVLLGGDGSDALYGESGRDLLIGGNDADDLSGGLDDDILIGGSTDYDSRETVDAFDQILESWDVAEDYLERVSALEDPRHGYHLESTVTVHDDSVSDFLRGQSGQDWFFYTGQFKTTDDTASTNASGIQYGTHWSKLAQLDDLTDIQPEESLHTVVQHPRNEAMRRNHVALFDLVNPTSITHTAVASGPWSAASTWRGGIVPDSAAHIRIEQGVTVTVDQVFDIAYETIYVVGVLDFDPTRNTVLRVDTMIVDPHGRLEIGTASAPIATDVQARISITDGGPIDRVRDPFALGRGIISHGAVEFHGAAVTPWVGLSQAPRAGQSELVLDQVPINWNIGDTVLLPGTNSVSVEDESLTILAISGNRVTVSPLEYDHIPPQTSLTVHLAHLNRNIVIESEGESVDRRGHVMFMHQREVNVNYVGFENLGRTDKKQLANDPVIDAAGTLLPGTGTNALGRYAVHFHRNGVVNDGRPSNVHGSVVIDNPGWGYVNHSSFVNFTSNIAYDVDGSAFVTEAGDEIGSFTGNLAIRGVGSGEALEDRNEEQDFGHQGDGFWFQGAGIEVQDNVAAGQAGHGYLFFTLGLRERDLGEREFLSSNLTDPSIAGGQPTIAVQDVPIREFRRNIAYASKIGVGTLFSLLSASHGQTSVIEDITVWNNETGIDLQYTADMVLRNVTVVKDDQAVAGVGIESNDVTRSITYDNVSVDGYLIGLKAPLRGSNTIRGGAFRNLVNVFVQTNVDERTLVLTGDINFQSLIDPTYGIDVWLGANTNVTQNMQDIYQIFLPDKIILDYENYINQQVFFREQAPEFVLFPSLGSGIPEHLVGLTAQQIMDQFGLRLGDGWAPWNSIQDPRIFGLIGPS